MQFKPIAVILVLFLVVASLLVAGCTSSTNTTTPTSLPTSDTAAAITNEFSQSGYVIIIPFVKSTNAAGIVTYTGIVKDGENSLTPYTHNLTLEVTKNRNDTTTRFDAWVRNATQRGYTGSVQDAGIARYWSGTQGAAVMNATHGVWIVGQQPKGFTTVLYASQPPKSVSALSDGYIVSADFATEA
jgi:Ca2+-binding RTX toxin-like protein